MWQNEAKRTIYPVKNLFFVIRFFNQIRDKREHYIKGISHIFNGVFSPQNALYTQPGFIRFTTKKEERKLRSLLYTSVKIGLICWRS